MEYHSVHKLQRQSHQKHCTGDKYLDTHDSALYVEKAKMGPVQQK